MTAAVGTERAAASSTEDSWARSALDDARAVLPAWLVARVLVAAAYVVAVVVADRLVPGDRPHQIDEGLLAWDGTWYRDIATGGYARTGIEGLRFYPLFPLLGRSIGLGASSAAGPVLVVVANLASFVLLALVRRLVLCEGRGRAVAQRAVWFTALFPAAFVLAWGYAEAVMLAAAVGAFLAARRQRWWWAVVAGIVAAASRPLGAALALPMGIELARTWRRSNGPTRGAGVAAVVAPLLTAATYHLWVRSAYGDAWLPFRVQDELRRTTLNPFTRVWDGLEQLFGTERFGDGLHVPFAALFLVLLVLTFRSWPVSYGVYATAVLAAALGAENLNSLERYGLNAFPLVLTIAVLARDERVERAVLAVSAGGFTALAGLAWLGAYVP